MERVGGKEGSFGKSRGLIDASKVFFSPGVASQDHPPKQTEGVFCKWWRGVDL